MGNKDKKERRKTKERRTTKERRKTKERKENISPHIFNQQSATPDPNDASYRCYNLNYFVFTMT